MSVPPRKRFNSTNVRRSSILYGITGKKNQDSWDKCGEGFEGIGLKGPKSVPARRSLVGDVVTEEKEIASFSSDSEDEGNITLPWKKLSSISRKRKRETKRKTVKELFRPVPKNEDVDIDTFSPSKLSGNSVKCSAEVSKQNTVRCLPKVSKQNYVKHLAKVSKQYPNSQKSDDLNIETFSPSKLSVSSTGLNFSASPLEFENVENDDLDDVNDIKEEQQFHDLSDIEDAGIETEGSVKTNSQAPACADILDYSSSEEQDGRRHQEEPPEISELEGPTTKVASSSVAPSVGVLQRLKLDSVTSDNDGPSRLDDPSPKKRQKYLKGQLADRLVKMIARESSEVAFWKHKVSKKTFTEETAKTMALKVQTINSNLTLTFAKCEVLEDNREEKSCKETVTILLNKEQASSLKICESQVLRIYPPWHEINMSNGETLLMCGKFCQVIKAPETMKKPRCPAFDGNANKVTQRWVYHIDEGDLGPNPHFSDM